VNSPQAAPGPDAGGSTGGPGETGHVVTALLRSDAVILLLARKAVEEGGGSAAAQLAQRSAAKRPPPRRRAWFSKTRTTGRCRPRR
jgi:hypothetical protein